MIGAVLLGAGFGTRFRAAAHAGTGTDKRLAPLGQSTVAATTLTTYTHVFDAVRLVVRPEDKPLQALASAHNHVEVVTTTMADRGMAFSLRAGFADLSWPYAFVGLLDMPFVATATLTQACELAAQNGYQHIVRPQLILTKSASEAMEKPPWGHPIGFPADLYPNFLQLEGDQGARQILATHKHRVIEMPTHDKGVVQDIDHPDDLAGA